MRWAPGVGFLQYAPALNPGVHQVDRLAKEALPQLPPQGHLERVRMVPWPCENNGSRNTMEGRKR